MDFVFDGILLSLGLSAVIILLLFYAAININFIRKNGFYVTANCWFCNEDSRILFSERNNFVCQLCCQYNGFNKDGGYNKEIKAQYEFSKFMTDETNATSTAHISSNGLCSTCNRNQELKVIQLSKFEPMNYKNYYTEIQHFEKQLEKSYGLCETCSETAAKTIREQSEWISGYKLQNPKNSKMAICQGGKKFSLVITDMFLSVLSFLNVLVLCNLDVFLPNTSTLPGSVILSNLYSSINNIASELGVNILPETKHVQFLNVLVLSSLGLIIELLFSTIFASNNFSTIFAQNNFLTKFDQLYAWFMLTVISSIDPKKNFIPYLEYLEIVFSLYLTYAYAATCIKRDPVKINYAKSLNGTNNTFFKSSDSANDTSFVSAQNHFDINHSGSKSVNSTNNTFFGSSNVATNWSFASAQNHSDIDQTSSVSVSTNSAISPISYMSVIDDSVSNQLQQQSPNRNMSSASRISTNNSSHMEFNASYNNICGTATDESALNTSFDKLKIQSPSKAYIRPLNKNRPLNPFKEPQFPILFNENFISEVSFNSDSHAVLNQNPGAASFRGKPIIFSTNAIFRGSAGRLVSNDNTFEGPFGLYNMSNYTHTSSAPLRRDRKIHNSSYRRHLDL
ncbi:unnamed protein product [Ceutorhynchus assimilis]|uniref:Ima1 N-terminal domain-containing protein n=1 Tax=Ceutorhynchus assimilis TaxID=467358 RepID=A0A9N9MD11_9CUCU|nr:unnamed protein product [Ceutorhynchus assimilis]